MTTNSVITIGRQFGSGGRQVGELLAQRLNIPYYDKQLLAEASKDSGICEEMFEDHDEKPTRSLLFSLVTGMQVRGDAGTMYMDIIQECEKLGDYVINVVEARMGVRQHDA